MFYIFFSIIFFIWAFVFRSKLIYFLICASLCLFISIGTWINSEKLLTEEFEVSSVVNYQLIPNSTFQDQKDDYRIFPLDNDGDVIRFMGIPPKYVKIKLLPREYQGPEFVQIQKRIIEVNPLIYFNGYYSQPNIYELNLYSWPKKNQKLK